MLMQAVRRIVDAEKLCKIVDIPEDMRYSQVEVIVLPFATVSRNGVAYFPFKTEKETMDWMENATSEWWDE